MIFYYTLIDFDEDKSTLFQISAHDEIEAKKKLFKKMFPYLITDTYVDLEDINGMINIMEYKIFKIEKEPVSI